MRLVETANRLSQNEVTYDDVIARRTVHLSIHVGQPHLFAGMVNPLLFLL